MVWKQVYRLKKQRGLGVLNLRLQNKAMLMKHLHKFLNKTNIPWVNLTWEAFYQNRRTLSSSKMCGSFWWKDLLHLLDEFKGLLRCSVFYGYPILNWPHLFSFAKNPNILVAHLLDGADFLLHFTLPLSLTAMLQLQTLRDSISSLVPLQDRPR